MPIWTLDNPVITKELRGRMRGARTYWLLFGYLLLLSLILFFSYLAWWETRSGNMQMGGAAASFAVGRMFFKILFYSQAVMIALITPALTAGAISVEREQRTFEMLMSTILRPRAIVGGKLTASVSFVVLLLTSSLPLLSLCFLLGGVSPGEVFFAYLLLAGDAFLFGAIGLCWSAYAANTATATVLSYASLFIFFILTSPFASMTIFSNGGSPSFGLSALNPLGAVTAAVTPERYYGWTWPAWAPALLLNGTLTALLVLACINRLEDFPARRAATLRLVTLLFAGLIVFFGDGVVWASATLLRLSPSDVIEYVLIIGLVVLLLFVPVLVTGDLEGWAREGQKSYLRQAWRPLGVFHEAMLPSGVPLALLLTAIVLGLTFAAVCLGGASLPQVDGLLRQASLMIAAVIFGIAGIGFLLSIALNNRWAALTLTYLATILGMALPGFTYGTLTGAAALAAAHNPAINSLYLCPFFALIQLAAALYPPTFGHDDIFSHLAGYASQPMWVTTSVIYVALGLFGYALALMLLRRQNVPTRTV